MTSHDILFKVDWDIEMKLCCLGITLCWELGVVYTIFPCTDSWYQVPKWVVVCQYQLPGKSSQSTRTCSTTCQVTPPVHIDILESFLTIDQQSYKCCIFSSVYIICEEVGNFHLHIIHYPFLVVDFFIYDELSLKHFYLQKK